MDNSSRPSNDTISSMGALFDRQGNRIGIDFNELSVIDDVDIPEFIRQHHADLRFPEKLMLLMTYIERTCIKKGENPKKACLAWTNDGKALIIRNELDFLHQIPADIFQMGKFTSFTRKLYRWGFRQKHIGDKGNNMTKPMNKKSCIKIFCHEHFQRDNRMLLVNMRSVTAEGMRRSRSVAEQASPREGVHREEHAPHSMRADFVVRSFPQRRRPQSSVTEEEVTRFGNLFHVDDGQHTIPTSSVLDSAVASLANLILGQSGNVETPWQTAPPLLPLPMLLSTATSNYLQLRLMNARQQLLLPSPLADDSDYSMSSSSTNNQSHNALADRGDRLLSSLLHQQHHHERRVALIREYLDAAVATGAVARQSSTSSILAELGRISF